jgi:hypothetical protein
MHMCAQGQCNCAESLTTPDEYRVPDLMPREMLEDVAVKLRAYFFKSQTQAAKSPRINRTTVVVRYGSGAIVAPLGYLANLAKLVSDQIEVVATLSSRRAILSFKGLKKYGGASALRNSLYARGPPGASCDCLLE